MSARGRARRALMRSGPTRRASSGASRPSAPDGDESGAFDDRCRPTVSGTPNRSSSSPRAPSTSRRRPASRAARSPRRRRARASSASTPERRRRRPRGPRRRGRRRARRGRRPRSRAQSRERSFASPSDRSIIAVRARLRERLRPRRPGRPAARAPRAARGPRARERGGRRGGWAPREREAAGGRPERTGHDDRVAGPRARARDGATRRRPPRRRHRDHDRLAAVRVAADERERVLDAGVVHPAVQLHHPRGLDVRRAGRAATSATRGLRAHRREIGDVDGDGLRAQVVRRDRRALEVDALDEEIRRQDELDPRRTPRPRRRRRCRRRTPGRSADSTRAIAAISSSSESSIRSVAAAWVAPVRLRRSPTGSGRPVRVGSSRLRAPDTPHFVRPNPIEGVSR